MHNVTERDGVFTVRGPAWWDVQGAHDLAEYPTRKQAQQIAHPWEPVAEPVFRRTVEERFIGSPKVTYTEVESAVLNTRSDDGFELGVVSKTFTPVTNSQLYDIAEAIEGLDKGSIMFETGGSLNGGRKVWLLIRLRDPLIVKGDPNGATIPYYALQNAHDGSASLRGQALMTRIVCDNTAHFADLEAQARGTEFTFRHTVSVNEKIEEAKAALAGWRTSIDHWRRLSEHLIELPVTKEQRTIFIEEFIPMPMAHTVSDRVVTNVNTARAALRSILEGETCEGIGLTSYGLVQGSVEYLEHARRAQSKESRFKRAYLDRNTIVTDAVDLAQKVAVSA